MKMESSHQASPFIPPAYPGDRHTGGVEMFGAEENDADPAQVEQLHLVVVSPVDLDDGDLAEQSCGWPADHARYCRFLTFPRSLLDRIGCS